jgi:hypothetical protein
MKLILLFQILFLSALSFNAEAYKVKDSEVILNDLEDYNKCQGDDYGGRFCQDALERWVKANPKDVFKAAKMTRLRVNAAVAVPFFAQAFEQKLGVCTDADLKLAVIAGLNLPASNKETLAQAKKMAFELCYEEMKEGILKESGTDTYLFKNACADLIAKKALTGLKLAKCKAVK